MKQIPNSFLESHKVDIKKEYFHYYYSTDTIFNQIKFNKDFYKRVELILEYNTNGFNCLPNLFNKIVENYNNLSKSRLVLLPSKIRLNQAISKTLFN